MSKIGDYFIKDDKDIGRGTFGNVYQAYMDRHPEVSNTVGGCSVNIVSMTNDRQQIYTDKHPTP